MSPQNTRHIPDLQAAEECISQAITAVKRNDPAFVDQCVTAALQYLQPEVKHVKDDTVSTYTVEIGTTAGRVFRLTGKTWQEAERAHGLIVNLKSLDDPTARFQIDTQEGRTLEVFADHIAWVDVHESPDA